MEIVELIAKQGDKLDANILNISSAALLADAVNATKAAIAALPDAPTDMIISFFHMYDQVANVHVIVATKKNL